MIHPVTEKARALRGRMTDAERHLWRRLRAKQLGTAFRRQYPVGPYIADFACLPARLLIEIDGGQHADQAAYDAARTAYLEKVGWKVLRFWNHDVLRETDAVVGVIAGELRSRVLSTSPSPSRPPP